MNSIPIYGIEFLDLGLDDFVLDNSICLASVARLSDQPDQIKQEFQQLSVAQEKQIDLFYLDALLVSTGWNKNDDVFDPEEVWAARNTPEDKPFNFEHNEKDIIGHITGNYVISDGQIVSEKPTGDFDIITNNVLYKYWEDTTLAERIQTIISEIPDQKWFVSMEAIFSDFDYSLQNENGLTKTIARNEQTAFLTKYLRVFGGTGVYKNLRVGRVLKNIVFRGKGLVRNPANSKSIILGVSSIMPKENEVEQLNKTVADLQSQKIEVENKLVTVQEDLDITKKNFADHNIKIKELEQSLASTITEKDGKISDLESVVAELTNKLAQSNTKVKDLTAKLDEVVLANTKKDRIAELCKIGYSQEEALKAVDKFMKLDETVFAEIVNVLNKTQTQSQGDETDSAVTNADTNLLDEALKEKQVTLAAVDANTNDQISDDLTLINESVSKYLQNNKGAK